MTALRALYAFGAEVSPVAGIALVVSALATTASGLLLTVGTVLWALGVIE